MSQDDYLGPSALNANLALKSIVSLAAFAQLCGRLGLKTEQEHYARIAGANFLLQKVMFVPSLHWSVCRFFLPTTAQNNAADSAGEYAAYWKGKTLGGKSGATRRTYDAPNSFSAKTNLIFDMLLGTQLFAQPDVVAKECAVMRETAGPFGWVRAPSVSLHLSSQATE